MSDIKLYTVRIEMDVRAKGPEEAAVVARDALLNPDARILIDVHPQKYIKEADEFFPDDDRGWYAEFEHSVRPKIFFSWTKLEIKL